MQFGAVSGHGEFNPVVDVVLVSFLEVGERIVFVDVIERELINYDEDKEV